jgi:hypothetical protein
LTKCKKNGIGGACGIYGREEGFLWDFRAKCEENLEGRGVDGRIILKWILKKKD